jgi:hypothetical protein
MVTALAFVMALTEFDLAPCFSLLGPEYFAAVDLCGFKLDITLLLRQQNLYKKFFYSSQESRDGRELTYKSVSQYLD